MHFRAKKFLWLAFTIEATLFYININNIIVFINYGIYNVFCGKYIQ